MNETYKNLLQEFKDYKIKIEGRSDLSLKEYCSHITQFLEYYGKTNKKIEDVSVEDITNWLIELTDKENNSPETRNGKLIAVRQFFLYLKKHKKMTINEDIFDIKLAKTTIKESRYLEWKVFEEFLSSIKNERTKLAVALLGYTGVRFSELIQITCQDIEKGYAIILGKGKKERQIDFHNVVIQLAKKWIANGRKKIVDKYNLDTDILLLSDYGNVIKRQVLDITIKRQAKKFNESILNEGQIDWHNHLSPHKFRHTFTTNLIQNGVDIRTAQECLGHNDLKTTSRYAHTSGERVRLAMTDWK